MSAVKSRAIRRTRMGSRLALSGALIVSGYLTAAALASPNYGNLVWGSLLPLLWTIRTLRPLPASVCGVLWALSLFISATSAFSTRLPATVFACALLTAVVGGYAGLGAAFTRWAGFRPVVLGAGWICVELALTPVGLDYGLVAGTQANRSYFALLGSALGYVFVAFLVAYVSAAALSLFGRVRLVLCARRASTSASSPPRRQPWRRMTPWPLFALRPSQPRAPPSLWG